MTAKTKAASAKAKLAGRIVWVWGDRKKGIALERVNRGAKGGYWWYVLHVKDGRVVCVHGNFNKAEAMRQAKSYTRYEEQHPRKGFCRPSKGSYLLN